MKTKWYSKTYDSRGMAERYMERTLKKYKKAIVVLQQLRRGTDRTMSYRVFVQLTKKNPFMNTEPL